MGSTQPQSEAFPPSATKKAGGSLMLCSLVQQRLSVSRVKGCIIRVCSNIDIRHMHYTIELWRAMLRQTFRHSCLRRYLFLQESFMLKLSNRTVLRPDTLTVIINGLNFFKVYDLVIHETRLCFQFPHQLVQIEESKAQFNSYVAHQFGSQ